MTKRVVEGRLTAEGRRFAIVSPRFNDFITERLVGGAIDVLVRHGAAEDDITVYRCPGSFELPLVAKRVAEKGEVDAVVCVGALVRGGTAHFDLIATWATRAIGEVSLTSGLPVTFGVLTCDTLEQAIERAGTKMGNKGAEAALAAIEMLDLLDQI